MSDVVVEARQLTKKYNDFTAVDRLDLQIEKGRCHGLLGPNGAGKSTTMKMIYGSSELTHGELYVLGLDTQKEITEIKSHIGVVPQEDGLDPDFSVLENLLVFSKYHRISSQVAKNKALALLQDLQLLDYQDRHVETLSGGMRRRLAIARSLLNDPQLLILDEPTTGLDPQARQWVWSFVHQLKKKGVTVLLSTHYMDEAEKLCDLITVIDHGRILDEGPPRALIDKHIGQEVVEFNVIDEEVNFHIKKIEDKKLKYRRHENHFHVYVPKNASCRDWLGEIQASTVSLRPATLDDVFLKLSGHDLRDE